MQANKIWHDCSYEYLSALSEGLSSWLNSYPHTLLAIREILARLRSSTEHNPQGVFRILEEEAPEFYTLLIVKIGEHDLFSNFFRYLVRMHISSLIEVSKTHISRLISISHIQFNRSTVLFRDQSADRYLLTPSVYIQAADHVAECINRLNSVENSLSKFSVLSGSNHLNKSEFNPKIASVLDMVHGTIYHIPLLEEQNLLKSTLYCIDQLHLTFQQLFYTSSEGEGHNSHSLSTISGLVQQLYSIQFSYHQTLSSWLQKLSTINSLLASINMELASIEISTSSFQPNTTQAETYSIDQMMYILASSLIDDGMSPSSAIQECQSLDEYCQQKRLHLSDLTSLDLASLETVISEQLLQKVQEIDKGISTSHGFSPEKELAWTNSQSLLSLTKKGCLVEN